MNTSPRTMARYPKPPSERRYRLWSAGSITLVAVVASILVGVLVFSLGHRSLLVETEITICVIAGGLFVFLAAGLYCGARVRREQLQVPSGLPWNDAADLSTPVDPTDAVDLSPVAESGFLGIIVSILLWIVMLFFVTGLWLVLVNFLWIGIGAMFVGVFWVFNRALRQVFARSRACRHRLLPSLGYAAFYTFAYTGWLLLVLFAAQAMRHHA